MGGSTMSKNIFFDINDLKYCGSNVIIGKTVRIRQPHLVSIGDGTIIDDFTYISSALEIGNYCHISSNACISGGNGKLLIGDYSTLSSHVSVHCGSSNYRSLSMDLPSIDENDRFGGITEDVTIGEFVTVGSHSCILPGSMLPNFSAYGAFTLVKQQQLKEYHLYGGLKCRDLGKRDLKNLSKFKKFKSEL
jgi:acetyltransferase-like isoleucine patch superfamily enzyme